MNSDISMLRTISEGLKAAKGYSPQQLMELKNEMIRNVFKVNPNIYSIWDSWEYSFLDPSWSKPYGRKAFTITNDGGNVVESFVDRSLDGDPILYANQKNNPCESAWEPYLDVYAEGKSEAKMMSTLSVPMMRNGRFIGLMAEDVTLDQFQSILEKIKPFEGTNAMLLSQSGTIAGHPNKSILAKNISQLKGLENHGAAIIDSIKAGRSCSLVAKDSAGVETYFSFAPIKVGRDNASVWALGISVPTGEIYAQNRGAFIVTLLVGLLGLAFLSIVVSILSKSITDPVKSITAMLNRMSRGELSDDMRINLNTSDELGDMGKAINRTLDGLIAKENFAGQIGQGHLDAKLELMSSDDRLGCSLLDMRNSLQQARVDEENRKMSDERQRWFAGCLANINEIIRDNAQDVEVLARSLVREVVLAVDANQGGIFLLNKQNEDDPIYEMKAAFAYNRDKLVSKSFRVGEGLLGACVAEKEKIYLREIPNNYIEITSGLGGANPRELLIVPFIHDNVVLGVIEIASFTSIEDYQQEMILKVSENVASAIASAQTSSMTNELLEQSKIQAEMMAAQEEEMRQNLEELRSTQEEAQRQSDQVAGMVQAFGKSVMWTEYDMKGRAVGASESMIGYLKISPEKIIGQSVIDELTKAGYSSVDVEALMNSIRCGASKRLVVERQVNGEPRRFEETFVPVYEGSSVVKVLKISYDISQFCLA